MNAFLSKPVTAKSIRHELASHILRRRAFMLANGLKPEGFLFTPRASQDLAPQGGGASGGGGVGAETAAAALSSPPRPPPPPVRSASARGPGGLLRSSSTTPAASAPAPPLSVGVASGGASPLYRTASVGMQPFGAGLLPGLGAAGPSLAFYDYDRPALLHAHGGALHHSKRRASCPEEDQPGEGLPVSARDAATVAMMPQV